MVSIRQQILTAIKTYIEDDATLYNAASTTLINKVYVEPRSVKQHRNVAEIYIPDAREDMAEHDPNAVRKVDTSAYPVHIQLTFKNVVAGTNDFIYQLLDNLRTLVWTYPTLGLGSIGVALAHVDASGPILNPDDQTVIDGALVKLRVITRESF